jgi:ribonuclease inhibitor
MRIVIDGARIHSESDLHDLLSMKLDFGPYYGRNLAALWDRLSTDVERPVELIWMNFKASKDLLGAETAEQIASVLTRVMEQDDSFGWDDKFTVRFE